MATYSAVSSGEKDANSPITESLINKLDQNPLAMFEGAVGAPKIQTAAHASASITQALLKTTTQELSSTSSSLTGVHFIFSGGEYSFYPQIKCSADTDEQDVDYFVGKLVENGTSITTYATRLFYEGTRGSQIFYGKMRYVQASPPYELGGVDMPHFVFLHVDALGNVISVSSSEDPTWAYNGPTDVRPDLIEFNESTKKHEKFKLRKIITPEIRALKKDDPEAYADAVKNLKEKKIRITPEMKNADIELFPHPFGNVAADEKVILVAPDDAIMASIREFALTGESINELFHKDHIRIMDSVSMPGSPLGVQMGRARWKKTRGN